MLPSGESVCMSAYVEWLVFESASFQAAIYATPDAVPAMVSLNQGCSSPGYSVLPSGESVCVRVQSGWCSRARRSRTRSARHPTPCRLWWLCTTAVLVAGCWWPSLGPSAARCVTTLPPRPASSTPESRRSSPPSSRSRSLLSLCIVDAEKACNIPIPIRSFPFPIPFP